MWDRWLESKEMFQKPPVTWKIFLIYFGLTVIIFIAGYAFALFVRWRRRSKPGASESADIEAELKFLEAAIEKAKSSVIELLHGAQLKQQAGTQSYTVKYKTYRGPERKGKVKKFIKFLRERFQRSRESTETQDEVFTSRLRELKLEVKDITDNIQSVSLSLNPNLQHKSKQGVVEEVARDLENEVSTKNSYTKTDLDIVDLFNASSNAESKLETGLPTIHRQHRSFQAEDRTPEQVVHSKALSADVSSEIIKLYNSAVTDSYAREQFRDLYQPLRLGTVNAVERRQNPTIDAEFKETTDGDFFAFPISGRNEYAVVPRLGLTIETVSYNAGALGQVFNYPSYDSKQYYSRYHLHRPATFKRDGNHWELLFPGELDLGPGD